MRGYVEIRNGPITCKVDLDRPITSDEMRALAPIAAAIENARQVFEQAAHPGRNRPS